MNSKLYFFIVKFIFICRFISFNGVFALDRVQEIILNLFNHKEYKEMIEDLKDEKKNDYNHKYYIS